MWQSALKAQNSVWQFYQLTMTQWPVPGGTPANPGTPNFSFPGAGATSAFANTRWRHGTRPTSVPAA